MNCFPLLNVLKLRIVMQQNRSDFMKLKITVFWTEYLTALCGIKLVAKK